MFHTGWRAFAALNNSITEIVDFLDESFAQKIADTRPMRDCWGYQHFDVSMPDNDTVFS